MLCKLKQGFKNNKSKNCITYLLLWLSDLTSRTHVWHCYSHAQIFFNKAFHVNKVKPELLKFHVQFSSVQSLSHVWLLATPWITARQASLSITNTRSSLKLTSIESVMPSSHFILCRLLLLLPPIPPSIRVFSNESTLHMRWPKYWSFSFSIIRLHNLDSFSFVCTQIFNQTKLLSPL